MKTLLLPTIRPYAAVASPSHSLRHLFASIHRPPTSLFLQSRHSTSPQFFPLLTFSPSKCSPRFQKDPSRTAQASYPDAISPSTDDPDKGKLAQVAKRLETTARYFRRLGNLSFWAQLVCSVVAAGILSFSIIATGKITSGVTFLSTAGGLVAAFVSVFWSFGYVRLSDRLRKTANDPSKAPPRADVVQSLRNGIVLNVLGMGAAILGMQATVGTLVAKALTSSANPYYQGVSPGYSPVLALDVFLVQASANTILSHFFGLIASLELLRSVTVPPEPVAVPVPSAS